MIVPPRVELRPRARADFGERALAAYVAGFATLFVSAALGAGTAAWLAAAVASVLGFALRREDSDPTTVARRLLPPR